MHKEKILRFGLPTGSLNDLRRWNTKEFLDSAGFYTKGYDPSSRNYYPTFTNYWEKGHVQLEAVAVRPQNVPFELHRTDPNGLDIAITGRDWALEGASSGYPIVEFCSLGYGYVGLVATVHKDLDIDSISDLIRLKKQKSEVLRCYSEYIDLAKKTFCDEEAYREIYGDSEPQLIVKGRIISGKNPLVQVIDSQGTSELNVPSGFGDMIVENTQTGITLLENKYKVLKELGKSCACLYAGPHITRDMKDGWKYEEAIFIKEMLESATLAKNYDYYVFDVPIKKEEKVREYIAQEGLFAREPIWLRGSEYSECKILVPKEMGLKVVKDLKRRGAEAIVTLKPERLVGMNPNNNHKRKY